SSRSFHTKPGTAIAPRASSSEEIPNMTTKKPVKRWSHQVKTVSTFPPEGTFMKDAKSVARIMASKKVSPKGIGSGIRMIQFFINRGGNGLSASRKKQLQRAIEILREKSHNGPKHHKATKGAQS